jgi:regulator of replication initiation timing
MHSMDEAKIYKQKLSLLGDCFRTVVRKVINLTFSPNCLIFSLHQASETSEQWATITTHLDEKIVDIYDDVDKLHSIDQRFEQSLKIFTQLRTQHEDLVLQFLSLKSIVEKAHLYLRGYKHKWTQINDDNRRLHIENKHLHDKIDSFHRVEHVLHAKNDEQEINLGQLRKELK